MPSLELIVVASIVAAVAYLAAITATVVVLALRLGGRREDSVDDRDALSESRFTIPASLIVPLSAALNSDECDATVASLLDLNYPELEVIVVAGEPQPALWQSLKNRWALEAREFFYRAKLATAPVRMMYRSARDPRLLVVIKDTGSIADALNCGLNLARYRYVGAIEPGVTFDRDALLRAMTAPLRDPAGVVGATSHVETSGGTLQRLQSIRALMDSRLVWRHLDAALGPRDAVVVWRRDAVDHVGGFSTAAADPHLDMMVRLQTSAATAARGQVVRTAEIFGQRHPRPLGEYVRLTARRQFAALQAVKSLLPAGRNTRVMLGYFFVCEVLTPLVQAWFMLATSIGAAAGWLPWGDVGLAVLLLAIGHAVVGGAALLVRGALPFGPDARGVRRMLLLAPLNVLLFGAAAGYARTAGLWAFVASPRSGQTAAEGAADPVV